MFIDNGIGSYNPATGRTIRPIYGRPQASVLFSDHTYSWIEFNRATLRKFALLALADHKMLKRRMISSSEFADSNAPSPEKTYTFTVNPEDIDKMYGKSVMFANKKDVDTLVDFLEEKVGPTNMRIFYRKIGGTDNGDPVAKVAREWRAKWKNGEEWPLEA